MSLFNDGMALATAPAFHQMSESVTIGDTVVDAIYDPIEKSERGILGGIDKNHATNVYVKREDFPGKQGVKIIFTQGGNTFKGRVVQIVDDDTDVIVLQCTGLVTGAVPRV